MKRFLALTLLAAVICLSTSGCHQTSTGRNPWPKGTVPWSGFGEPGAEKISVEVEGDVAHPGQYFLGEGSNLESIMYSVGGAGHFGDMRVPPQTVKLIRSVNGQPENFVYPIRKMTKEEREEVLLRDGDTLDYPEIVF